MRLALGPEKTPIGAEAFKAWVNSAVAHKDATARMLLQLFVVMPIAIFLTSLLGSWLWKNGNAIIGFAALLAIGMVFIFFSLTHYVYLGISVFPAHISIWTMLMAVVLSVLMSLLATLLQRRVSFLSEEASDS
jgi:ABC-type lipoprotein release transport system permease subunit